MPLGIISFIQLALLVIGQTSVDSPTRQMEKGSSGLAADRHRVSCFMAFANVTHTFCFDCVTIQIFMEEHGVDQEGSSKEE